MCNDQVTIYARERRDKRQFALQTNDSLFWDSKSKDWCVGKTAKHGCTIISLAILVTMSYYQKKSVINYDDDDNDDIIDSCHFY